MHTEFQSLQYVCFLLVLKKVFLWTNSVEFERLEACLLFPVFEKEREERGLVFSIELLCFTWLK